jgi:hypothetical protein
MVPLPVTVMVNVTGAVGEVADALVVMVVVLGFSDDLAAMVMACVPEVLE